MGCTTVVQKCGEDSVSLCTKETDCITYEGYWCDENSDGAYTCQPTTCTQLENLTGDVSDLNQVTGEEDLGNLDQMNTDPNAAGLPDLGSI
jgi:hypothetical protein